MSHVAWLAATLQKPKLMMNNVIVVILSALKTSTYKPQLFFHDIISITNYEKLLIYKISILLKHSKQPKFIFALNRWYFIKLILNIPFYYDRNFTPKLVAQSCISTSTEPFSATITNVGENLLGSIAAKKC